MRFKKLDITIIEHSQSKVHMPIALMSNKIKAVSIVKEPRTLQFGRFFIILQIVIVHQSHNELPNTETHQSLLLWKSLYFRESLIESAVLGLFGVLILAKEVLLLILVCTYTKVRKQTQH